jgi:hypothetical protein
MKAGYVTVDSPFTDWDEALWLQTTPAAPPYRSGRQMRSSVAIACLVLVVSGTAACSPTGSAADKPAPVTTSSESSSAAQSPTAEPAITGKKLRADIDAEVARSTSVRMSAEISIAGQDKDPYAVLWTIAREDGPPRRVDWVAGDFRMRVIGNTMYLPPLPQMTWPPRIVWIRYTAADLLATGKPGRALIKNRESAGDLSAEFAMLSHAGGFRAIDEPPAQGSALHGWGANVSLADLLADPEVRGRLLAWTDQGTKEATLRVEVWLDAKNRPALMTLKGGYVTLTQRYSSWDKHLKIKAPASNTFEPIFDGPPRRIQQ